MSDVLRSIMRLTAVILVLCCLPAMALAADEGGGGGGGAASVGGTAQAASAEPAVSATPAEEEGRTFEVTPQTLPSAIMEVQPGDTILLADGEYDYRPHLSWSGEKGRPITLKAKGAGAVFAGAISLEGCSYVIVDGIRLVGVEGVGVTLRNVSHCTVRNCRIEKPTNRGIMVYVGSYVTLENNVVISPVENHCLHLLGPCDHIIVRGNRSYGGPGNGIQIHGYAEQHPGKGIVADSIIDSNIFAGTGFGTGGAAINCAGVQRCLFRNNLLYKNGAGGIVLYDDQTDYPECFNKDNAVICNTVYFAPGEGRWSFKLRSSTTRTFVRSNIFFGGQYGTVSVADDSFAGLDTDYNLLTTHEGQALLGESFPDDEEPSFIYTVEQWQGEKGLDKHSQFMVDPRFVSVEMDDYRLTADSPAIDAGADASRRCTRDIQGTRRPQGAGLDCGAFEYFGAALPPSAKAGVAAVEPPAARPAQGAEPRPAGGGIIEADPQTIYAAIVSARPGDTILAADGEYPHGFEITWSGQENAPITVKAKGANAVFHGPVSIAGPDWIILDGLKVIDSPSVGIVIEDSRNCVVRNCTAGNPADRCIYVADAPFTVIENNELFGSKRYHGITLRRNCNGSIVRNNYIHDNIASAVQIDAESNPVPDFPADRQPEAPPVSGLLVEGNRCARNGAAGGAAFNCSNVHNSLFRNNLLYKNLAGGFTFYRGDFPRPAPPCQGNKVVCNTVYFEPGKGRFSFRAISGARDFYVHDNIFSGGLYGTVMVGRDSMEGLDMDDNVIAAPEGQVLFGDLDTTELRSSEWYSVDEWRKMGLDRNSRLFAADIFTSIEKDDYRPKAGFAAIDAGADVSGLCSADLEGVGRPQGKAFDCGAYEVPVK